MKYVDVSDEFVKGILSVNNLLNEKAEEAPQVVEEEVNEEEHYCPMCESQLEEPISEDKMQECIDIIVDALNEAIDSDGEELNEEEDQEDEDEE